MAVRLSDAEIAGLVAEHKVLPPGVSLAGLQATPPQPTPGQPMQLRASWDLVGVQGHVFRLIVRQSSRDSRDFSVIVGYVGPGESDPFPLRRYDSATHEHKNRIESDQVGGFHIHAATERYQRPGLKPDGYARSTADHEDLPSAPMAACADCRIVESPYPAGLEWG